LKQIGILEIIYHDDFLYTMCKICQMENTSVTVFTTKDIFSKVEKLLLNSKTEYEWILKEDRESCRSYLKRVKQICDSKIDLLFVNTIQGTWLDLCFSSFRVKSRSVLTIHNINSWLKIKPSFRISSLKRTMDHNIGLLARKSILSKYDAINVIYSPLKDYIRDNTRYTKPVFTIPFKFYEKSYSPKEIHQTIRFIISGSIQKGRREYEPVIGVFEKLLPRYQNLELFLLGEPVGDYGHNIICRCKELRERGYSIHYFDRFVPWDVWQGVFDQSDVVILPFVEGLETEFCGVKETYGVTKGTAVVFDCIRHAKPLLVPQNFNLIKELESSTLKYENLATLEYIIENLVRDKGKLQYLQREALLNSERLSLGNIQNYFENEILNRLLPRDTH
jgi:hypothetical protein